MPAMTGSGTSGCVVLNSRTVAVVVLSGEADLVLRRRQLLLQLEHVLVRLQVGIVLDQREQLTQRAGEDPLRLGRLSRRRRPGLLRAHGRVAGLDDLRQRLLLEVHVALDGVDEVRDQVVPPLQLHADLVPGFVDHVPQPDQAVVGEDQEERDDHDDDQDDPDGFIGARRPPWCRYAAGSIRAAPCSHRSRRHVAEGVAR